MVEKCNIQQSFEQYSQFILRRYGMDVIVVFDRYSEKPSTKDHKHRHRCSTIANIASEVNIEPEKLMAYDQQTFLANEKYKQLFIKYLMGYLSKKDIQSKQSDADADTLIVATGINLTNSSPPDNAVGVVAEDTDILV